MDSRSTIIVSANKGGLEELLMLEFQGAIHSENSDVGGKSLGLLRFDNDHKVSKLSTIDVLSDNRKPRTKG